MDERAAARPSEFEQEGIPDTDLSPNEVDPGGLEGMAAPGDRPNASIDYGTTVEEQRRDEPLDGRLAREEPDPTANLDLENGEPYPIDTAETGEPAGRIVSPSGDAFVDEDADEIGFDVGPESGDLSAEEAAMTVIPEGLGGISDDPDPGYLTDDS
jgi:hypothetical protein